MNKQLTIKRLATENADIQLSNGIKYNLYFVDSDAIIRSDDWIFETGDWNIKSIVSCIRDYPNIDINDVKIVASTDKELGLPSIPKEFIDYYIEKDGDVDTIDVELTSEYDCDCELSDVICWCCAKPPNKHELYICNNEIVLGDNGRRIISEMKEKSRIIQEYTNGKVKQLNIPTQEEIENAAEVFVNNYVSNSYNPHDMEESFLSGIKWYKNRVKK